MIEEIQKLKAEYFQGWLSVRSFGEPGHWKGWRDKAEEQKQQGFDLIVFKMPCDFSSEVVEEIEKFLQDKFDK